MQTMDTKDVWCPMCSKQGKKSRLNTFQINLDEAITMCPNTKCPYPMCDGSKVSDVVLPRSFIECVLTPKKTSTSILKATDQRNKRKFDKVIGENKHCKFEGHIRTVRTVKGSMFEGHSPTVEAAKGSMFEGHSPTVPAVKGSMFEGNSPTVPAVKGSMFEGHSPTVPAVKGSMFEGHSPTVQAAKGSMFEGHSPTVPAAKGSMLLPVDGNFVKSLEELPNIGVSASNSNVIYGPENVYQKSSHYITKDSDSFIPMTKSPKKHLSISKETGSQSSERYKAKFLQWENRDALCWLDVSMCLLVHCIPFYLFLQSTHVFTKKSLLYKLCKVYYNAKDLLKQALQFQNCSQLARDGRSVTVQTSIGKITVCMAGGASSHSHTKDITALTNGRNSKTHEWIMSPDELDERAQSLIEKAISLLENIRTQLWTSLQPRLKCQLGRNDSPVFALPLMWKEHKLFEEFFLMKYKWEMNCEECGYRHTDIQEKTLPSFPQVEEDFCMTSPYFLRPCFHCEASNQRLTMVYKSLPKAIVVHFVGGLHKDSMISYDFLHQGEWYVAKAVVQYRNNPDHFVVWIRDVNSNQWMECDGLKAPVCSFEGNQPQFSLTQVHLVMWECLDDTATQFVADPAAYRLMANCSQNKIKINSDVSPVQVATYIPQVISMSSSPDSPLVNAVINPNSPVVNAVINADSPVDNAAINSDSSVMSAGINPNSVVVNSSLNPDSPLVNALISELNISPQTTSSVIHRPSVTSDINHQSVTSDITLEQHDNINYVTHDNTMNSTSGFTSEQRSETEEQQISQTFVSKVKTVSIDSTSMDNGMKTGVSDSNTVENGHNDSNTTDSKNMDSQTGDFRSACNNVKHVNNVCHDLSILQRDLSSVSHEPSSLHHEPSNLISGIMLGGTARNVLVNGVQPIAEKESVSRSDSLTNSGLFSVNYHSNRTSKQLADINRYIVNSLKNGKTTTESESIEVVYQGYIGNDSGESRTIIKNSSIINQSNASNATRVKPQVASSDRLQKMGEVKPQVAPSDRLQKMREVKPQVSSLDRLQKMRQKLELSKLKQNSPTKKGMGHLSCVGRDVSSRSTISSTLSVLRSPCHQKASMQELLAKIKGNRGQQSTTQQFDGYKPKTLNKKQKRKHPEEEPLKYTKLLSPKKSPRNKGKKISFGKDNVYRGGKDVHSNSMNICHGDGVKSRMNLTNTFTSYTGQHASKYRKIHTDVIKPKHMDSLIKAKSILQKNSAVTSGNHSHTNSAVTNGNHSRNTNSAVTNGNHSRNTNSAVTNGNHSRNTNSAVTNGNHSRNTNSAVTNGNYSRTNSAVTNGNHSRTNSAVTNGNHSRTNSAVTNGNHSRTNSAVTNGNHYHSNNITHTAVNDDPGGSSDKPDITNGNHGNAQAGITFKKDTYDDVISELCATLDIPIVTKTIATNSPSKSASFTNEIISTEDFDPFEFENILFGDEAEKDLVNR